MKVVFISSGPYSRIWWYPEYASKKDKRSHPAVESTIWSTRGRGKWSFGQARLMCLKLIHIRSESSFLGTMTTLASHSEWYISRMNSAARSRATSLPIAFLFFVAPPNVEFITWRVSAVQLHVVFLGALVYEINSLIIWACPGSMVCCNTELMPSTRRWFQSFQRWHSYMSIEDLFT